MTLSVSLSPETEAELRRQAQEAGLELEPFAARLIDRAVRPASGGEDLSAFRREVAASGMSDEALDELFGRLREAAWRARQG